MIVNAIYKTVFTLTASVLVDSTSRQNKAQKGVNFCTGRINSLYLPSLPPSWYNGKDEELLRNTLFLAE